MKRIATLFAGLLLIGGCSKTVNNVDVSGNGSGYNWIKTDPMLSNIATVTRVNKTFVNGFLQVQIELESHWWGDDVIQYQFTWLDENGMVLDTPMTGWQRKSILGYQKTVISGVAPEQRCKDVRVEMKRGKI
jgi:uncharacterized protein YcfL